MSSLCPVPDHKPVSAAAEAALAACENREGDWDPPCSDCARTAVTAERENIRLELLCYVDDLAARNADEAAAVERAVAKVFGSIAR